MNRIIRFYNQNRKEIWEIIIIVAFFFLLLKLLNFFVGKKGMEEVADVRDLSNVTITKSNNVDLTDTKSVVTGTRISVNKLEKEVGIIEEFLNNISESKIEDAYNMLTDECKEEMYRSIDSFKENYCESKMSGNGSYTVENWVRDTYKVRKIEDMLSTGKSNEGKAKEDHITVEEKDDKLKLNINNYIGRKEMQQGADEDGIITKILYRDTYMDFDKYTIEIENKTDGDVVMDTKSEIDSMYIEDSNKLKYPAITNEIAESNLLITSGNKKVLKIKYYSSFESSKKINRLVFSDVDKYDEEDAIKISINL